MQKIHERFAELFNKYSVNPVTQESFYNWLKLKYPKGLPRKTNLELEWRRFLAEATSHL